MQILHSMIKNQNLKLYSMKNDTNEKLLHSHKIIIVLYHVSISRMTYFDCGRYLDSLLINLSAPNIYSDLVCLGTTHLIYQQYGKEYI